MTTFLKNTAALVLLTIAIAACTTPNPSQTLPEITFQHSPELRLAVGAMKVETRYAAPLKSPNIEHKMDTNPAQALAIWTNDRLKAGNPGTLLIARMTIERASILEVPLSRTKGITGAFTTDQSHRYDLEMQATLEILDEAGQRLGHANTRATRSQTMPENATLNELHQAWFNLMEQGLSDFDKEMEANIRRFLAAWVR